MYRLSLIEQGHNKEYVPFLGLMTFLISFEVSIISLRTTSDMVIIILKLESVTF